MSLASHEAATSGPDARPAACGFDASQRARSASWRLATSSMPGAVAVIEVFDAADGIGPTLGRLGLGAIAPGTCVVRDLLGVDRGLVAQVGDTTAWLMPHGGIGVVRELGTKLESRGVGRATAPDVRAAYPEAADSVEAAVLDAVARAPSPLAVDLLLDQPRRWRRVGAVSEPTRDAILMRLLVPPLVVAVGASNIGKSTLLNTLAGRGVAIVADEPGTTRDHVGIVVDFGGLWVRFIDTPGVRQGLRGDADSIELAAIASAQRLARGADLVISCGDPTHEPLDVGAGVCVRVCLRSDLGTPTWTPDVCVSCRRGDGLETLVAAVREALVPMRVLQNPGPWKFWDSSPS